MCIKKLYLWFAITVMCQVLELACGTEFADVFLSSFGCDVKASGDGEICVAVEL